ncbi:MAG TPA: hypothetical protein VH643_05045 [Gemmataceae bacterium]
MRRTAGVSRLVNNTEMRSGAGRRLTGGERQETDGPSTLAAGGAVRLR